MTTNLQVIEDALKDINILGETDTASAEQGAHGLRKLNQMMDLWRETKDIELGYFGQTSTAATIPIPEWAELAVTEGLAIAIAPKYGKTISQELIVIADAAVHAVQRKCMTLKQETADMSHLPRGSGKDYRWDINTDS